MINEEDKHDAALLLRAYMIAFGPRYFELTEEQIEEAKNFGLGINYKKGAEVFVLTPMAFYGMEAPNV